MQFCARIDKPVLFVWFMQKYWSFIIGVIGTEKTQLFYSI